MGSCVLCALEGLVAVVCVVQDFAELGIGESIILIFFKFAVGAICDDFDVFIGGGYEFAVDVGFLEKVAFECFVDGGEVVVIEIPVYGFGFFGVILAFVVFMIFFGFLVDSGDAAGEFSHEVFGFLL